LVHAAIAGYAQLLQDRTIDSTVYCVLMASNGIATLFGAIYLCSFQKFLVKNRKGLNEVYCRFTSERFEEIIRAIRGPNRPITVSESFFHDAWVLFGIAFVEGAASLLVYLLLYDSYWSASNPITPRWYVLLIVLAYLVVLLSNLNPCTMIRRMFLQIRRQIRRHLRAP
jgi:hypothetical protein